MGNSMKNLFWRRVRKGKKGFDYGMVKRKGKWKMRYKIPLIFK